MYTKKLISGLLVTTVLGFIILPIVFGYGSDSVDDVIFARFSWKLSGIDGSHSEYSTPDGNLSLKLAVTHDASEDQTMAYTIFMDGKRISVFWDNKCSKLYKQRVPPNKTTEIEIGLRGIPPGIYKFSLAAISFPSKHNWSNEEVLVGPILSPMWIPFTVRYQTEIPDSDDVTSGPVCDLLSPRENEWVKNIGAASIDRTLSFASRGLKIDPFFDSRDRQTIYYYWRNSIDTRITVRFALLKNWVQIPGPDCGSLLLEADTAPGDGLFKEIDLTKVIEPGVNHFVVLAFCIPWVLV